MVGCVQLWHHWAVPVLFIAWALADISRYPWYAAAQIGIPPKLLTWLRYEPQQPYVLVSVLVSVAQIKSVVPPVLQWQSCILYTCTCHSAAEANLDLGQRCWLCRYTAFVPLYPLGIFGGEMPLIYTSLPYLRDRQLHSLRMPNSFNYAFSYHYFALVRLSPLLRA